MTFVYFAHSPDQKLLEQSARNLRRIYNNPRIVVYWEEGKEGFLEGAENKVSYFNRGGNLNGVECCKGMIDCMIEVNDDIVFKIDCDTIVTRPLENFENFLFFEAVQGFCGVGCCYGIRRHVLELCKKRLENYASIPGCQYSEDLTLSVLCQNVSLGELKLWNYGEHILGYDYSMNWDRYSKVSIIHMGNPDYKIDPRIKKARDFAHMKLFIDYLEKT